MWKERELLRRGEARLNEPGWLLFELTFFFSHKITVFLFHLQSLNVCNKASWRFGVDNATSNENKLLGSIVLLGNQVSRLIEWQPESTESKSTRFPLFVIGIERRGGWMDELVKKWMRPLWSFSQWTTPRGNTTGWHIMCAASQGPLFWSIYRSCYPSSPLSASRPLEPINSPLEIKKWKIS